MPRSLLRSVIACVAIVPLTMCSPDGEPADSSACDGVPTTIVGTERADVLRGTPGRDVISGEGGDDTLVGLGGNDLLCGGAGDDQLGGGPGQDRLVGEPGQDRCHLGADGGERTTCEDPTVMAAGDIACAPDDADFAGGNGTDRHCRQADTAALVAANDSNLAAVLVLGDLQYEVGSLSDFLASYDPTWGPLRDLTHPVPGNNEYETRGASGYFSYFGDAAGPRPEGFYSFDLAGWHFVALNSQCWLVGGCGEGDPQARWLRRDLAASDAACTIAFFHHPWFCSSAPIVNDSVEAIWRVLYEAGSDIVLNGHNHNYERFAPQDPGGRFDQDQGVREFIVGTGGVNLSPFPDDTRLPNSESSDDQTFGILELTLHPRGYEWRFIPVESGTFSDQGASPCVA